MREPPDRAVGSCHGIVSMFERFARSWELAKASAAVLRSDRELLILPIVAGICALIVSAAFIVPAFVTGILGDVTGTGQEGPESVALYVWLFVFYVVQYFVILFFNTALVGAALERLRGGDPTLGSAIALAASRIGAIAGYAVIAATVGVVLRFIGERLGPIGRIVEGVLGVAWTVTTFLVVPVIAARGLGPIAAVKESASLLRRSWGENIIGSAGIGLVFGLMIFAIAIVGFGLTGVLVADRDMALIGWAIAAVTVVALCIVWVYAAALGAVYSAAVYSFATSGTAPRGFDPGLLSAAFRAKKG